MCPRDDSNDAERFAKPSNADMASRARIGGLVRASNLSQEALSEAGSNAVKVRWDRERARREAEGLPPLRSTPAALTDDELAHWCDVVDEKYPDRVFENRMQRRRLAIRLARQEAARIVSQSFRHVGGAQ